MVSVTIANGQTVSGAVNLGKKRLAGIELPAGLTGTAMTFQASIDGGTTYTAVYATGGASAYSITVGTSRYVPVDRDVFSEVQHLKVVSGSAEGADRTIKLAVRAMA